MFDDFAGAIVALMFLLFGVVTGVGVGERLVVRCVTRREYLLANVAVLLVGALACAVAMLTPIPVLVVLVIGLIGGIVAGLKLGFGESVGPWKPLDRYFRVNRDQLRRSEDGGRAEAVRRARRDGTPEPELMSVQRDDAPARGRKDA